MRTTLRLGLGLGLILGSLLAVDVGAQGPYSAQIQRALNGFVATAHTWTGTQTFTGTVLLADGATGTPSLAQTTHTNTGLWFTANGSNMIASVGGSAVGAFNNGNNSGFGALGFGIPSGSDLSAAWDTALFRGAAGRWQVTNGSTIGSSLKVDALPTVTSCGAGSPAVVAGSTPLSGSVTIGTTSVTTCTITFNGTAFPSAPHCSGSVETGTAANTRAMGYVASTTALVIIPSAAWVDSSVVNWTCISPK